ncbi:bifunctional hydroxymethylpyrimidine kinase/phosphomethylpyrimidine kinase [Candidatus Bathyarchaeota archaeon]|nr:MAG: bifunctional hydroxymethylpyrimidine kinase/phosphomethylpyrimidine kinase [Candidatus Bathyarchaeota archaeon]
MVFTALTVAGVDGCGGAGVLADLKTFSIFKVHGACVVTALTAQNTKSVKKVLPVKPEFVEEQFQTILDDLKIDAVKTGILPSKETVKIVADFVDDYGLKLVVDPVFKSTTGKKFVDDEIIKTYIKNLLPLTKIVTPNIFEASILSGVKIKNMDDMVKAAEKILKFGVENVVVKGGHLKGKNVVDLFFNRKKSIFFTKPKLNGKIHGGGCFFSAALTACLASGKNVSQAIETVEKMVEEVFRFGLKIGKGLKVIHPLIPLYNEAEKYRVLEDVNLALNKFLKFKKVHEFIAEVGTQIAEALPYPSTIYHVAGVEGRIRKIEGKKIVAGNVRFGVSTHMARLILASNRLNPKIKAALNLRYDKKLLKALEKEKFTISSFDRRFEPKKIKMVEGKTLDWGFKQAVKKIGKVPDVIYDLGEPGKEPMIRILGENAVKLVEKVGKAVKNF